jgi:hypothetical protein
MQARLSLALVALAALVMAGCTRGGSAHAAPEASPIGSASATNAPSKAPIQGGSPSPSTTTTTRPPVTQPKAVHPVAPYVWTWSSWAFLDRRTGRITTRGNGTNSTESMIKIWIAADYLSAVGAAGRELTSDEQVKLSAMIRYSDDNAAQALYVSRGSDAVVQRMIGACGLTDTRVYHGWWSQTQVSARDAVRLGDCVADGRVTTPRWTEWILSEMRQLTGEGAFGIGQVRPFDHGKKLAVKNGWTRRDDGTWHVNCLAVADGWVLAVLVRYYPHSLGLDHGAAVCRSVASVQLRGV